MDRRSFLGFGAVASGILLSSTLRSSLAAAAEGVPGDVVDTTAGRIRGLRRDGVLAFRGVPYGASIAGSFRFMPPAKPQPWTRVRDAFEVGTDARKCPAA